MQHTCAHQREGDGKLGGEDEQRVGGLEAGNGGAEVPGKRHVGSARDACAARVGWGGGGVRILACVQGSLDAVQPRC